MSDERPNPYAEFPGLRIGNGCVAVMCPYCGAGADDVAPDDASYWESFERPHGVLTEARDGLGGARRVEVDPGAAATLEGPHNGVTNEGDR